MSAHNNAPTRFRVAFEAVNVRFNERIPLDIMYIDGRPILHTLYEGTKFMAAQFFPDVFTKTVWRKLLNSWAMTCTNYRTAYSCIKALLLEGRKLVFCFLT